MVRLHRLRLRQYQVDRAARESRASRIQICDAWQFCRSRGVQPDTRSVRLRDRQRGGNSAGNSPWSIALDGKYRRPQFQYAEAYFALCLVALDLDLAGD